MKYCDSMDVLNDDIRKFQRKIKSVAPKRVFDGLPRHVRTAIRHYDGKIQKELVILNIGLDGCAWNNCRMCGLSTNSEVVSKGDLQNELEYISKLPILDNQEISSLYFSPYSFFSDTEMTEQAREYVYRNIIENHKNIEYLIFMTRPSYITEEKIINLRKILPNHKVRLWIGLETCNEFVSKYCIDKGYTIKEVDEISIMLKKYNIDIGVWILLKPPFLTEKEGINDAVYSIKECLKRGYYVRLMPCEIMDYTIAKVLHNMGKFTSPSLWSVVEVLKYFTPDEHKRIDVSGPHFEREWDVVPKEKHSSHISKYPSACKLCNGDFMKLIDHYNTTKDLSELLEFSCVCKKEWEKSLMKESVKLEERICQEYLELINYMVKHENESFGSIYLDK